MGFQCLKVQFAYGIFFLLIECSLAHEHPIVKIPTLGSVLGSQMSSASGRNFFAFRGIPYGQPPVGNLRFKVIKFIS